MTRLFRILLMVLLLASTLVIHAAEKVELTQVNDVVWVHTSYFDYNGGSTPSNGLILNTRDGLVLIDTPWTEGETRELLQMKRQKFQKEIVLAVFTHAHQDRVGGIDTLLDQQIETMCTADTEKLILAAGYRRPRTIVTENPKTLSIGGISIELFYPGPAHTMDNIVIYIPQFKTLFGGCIVKASSAPNLGNVSEGDLQKYASTVQTLINRYPEAEKVIPGHGNWGGIELLRHTLQLAQRP